MAFAILNVLRPSNWTTPAIQILVLAAHAVPIAIGFVCALFATGFTMGKKSYVAAMRRLPS